MRRYMYFAAVLLLCASLLTACGNSENQLRNNYNGANSGDTAAILSTGEVEQDKTGSDQPDTSVSFLEPKYDQQSNTLTLMDLAANHVQASYSFNTAQSIIAIQKISNGIIMLVRSQMADEAVSNGIVFSTEGSSLGSLSVYRFDEQLKLQGSYPIEDGDMGYALQNYPLVFSPDGASLTWAQEDGIYQYTLETNELSQTSIQLSETVYFVQIQYSASGKYLFYYGDTDKEDVLAYGMFDLNTGKETLFTAKNFEAVSIQVTKEYAVVNASVPPGVLSGNGRVLLIDAENATGKEITLKSQAENDLAVVSDDGKTLVTCATTDEIGGILRCYEVDNSKLLIEKSYSSNQANRPYAIFLQQQTARAILYTDQGYVLSAAISLP